MPVLRSGSFTLHGYQVAGSTDWFINPTTGSESYFCTSSGPPLPATYMAWLPTILDTTADGTGLDPNFPPTGFTPTTSLVAESNMGGAGLGAFPSSWQGLFVDAFASPATGVSLPDNTTFASMLTPCRIVITSHGTTDAPFMLTDATFTESPAEITGHYNIVYWWWTLPPSGKDSCGNPQTGPCAGVPPGPLIAQGKNIKTPPATGYQLLDPTNPDTTSPTVVVNTIEPNVGSTSLTTAVTIKGSGFGSGATVTVGGFSCSSVVIVDAFTITCVVPAEAAGSGAVVVTNVDGSHN